MRISEPSLASSSQMIISPPSPPPTNPPPYPATTVDSADSESLPETAPAPPMIVVDHPDLDASATSTQVDPEAIVGGGDTQYSRRRLRLINTFHDIGLDLDLDLPIIAVVGSQSSGKSSLIQAISGVPLPRAPGDACTRCPIECRLMRGDGPEWSCCVFLRRVSASGEQSALGQTKEPFGAVITDKLLLEDRVLRAQLAVLNPSIPSQRFVDEDVDFSAPSESSFSPDIVCLEITGPDYTDISFVDLPGLIRNVGTSGHPENIQLIENLATSYIKKDNCIILMTITCETDFANQGAYEIARRYDPLGNRTVGVLTKPDRSPEAAHEKWVRYIKGEIEPLRHGWFCVKQYDTQSGHPQPTLEAARDQEVQWFGKTSVWRNLPRPARDRLGTKKLVQYLEEILSELISNRIPDISQQIRELVETTSRELERLGNPPSDDSIGEINTLLDRLVHDLEGGIERVSRKDGNLLYLIEDEAKRFKSELRATCPEFRAWKRDTRDMPSDPPLPEFLLEEGDLPAHAGTRAREIIYLDDVLNKKTPSSARGLPDGGQNEVAEEYLKLFTEKWDVPTNQFVRKSTILLRNFIHKTIDARCGKFSHGGLPSYLQETIEGHLEECLARTRTAMDLLLKLERNGHTRNERYYREWKDAFLTHLKIQRDLTSKNSVLRDLKRMASKSETQPHAPFVSAVGQIMSTLAKLGFGQISELDLAKLLQPQASDSALEDMAKASAGFEVSLHRFVDYVPLVIDTELVRGICQDLTTTLRTSFRLSDPDAADRCRDFLREPDNVQSDRELLRQRQRRLNRAEYELREFWCP